jgi:hypothetical protein
MRTARSESGDTHYAPPGMGVLDETVAAPDMKGTALRFVGPPPRS